MDYSARPEIIRMGNMRCHGLPGIMRALKTFSRQRINETVKSGVKFHWQKSFYDHLIREYIVNNPEQRDTDAENVIGSGFGGQVPDWAGTRYRFLPVCLRSFPTKNTPRI